VRAAGEPDAPADALADAEADGLSVVVDALADAEADGLSTATDGADDVPADDEAVPAPLHAASTAPVSASDAPRRVKRVRVM